MPSRILIQVVEARALPVMDSRSDLTDAYVELRVADLPTQKTDIKKKTLHPVWRQKFRFEVHNSREIEDVPIEFKIYDHDVMSKDDIIGIVSVDCSLLLTSDSTKISGWFPIHDTMRGIRGELYVVIEIEQISNVNQYKDSSAGMFVCSMGNPEPSFVITEMIGFVEELRVNSDPEYSVKDRIRASRASNNERKHTLNKLMGKLRRKIGVKVRTKGGNAIVGYCQHFDFEEKSQMIVARAYGTACKLVRNSFAYSEFNLSSDPSSEVPFLSLKSSYTKGNSTVEIMTVDSLPNRVIINQGGVVMARAIKEVKEGSKEKIKAKRDKWWAELREQIRGHAAALMCNCILGYKETVSVWDDVMVMTSVGTAAYIKPGGEKEGDRIEAIENEEDHEQDNEKEKEKDKEKEADRDKEKEKEKEKNKEKEKEHEKEKEREKRKDKEKEKEKDKDKDKDKDRDKDKDKDKEKEKEKTPRKKTKTHRPKRSLLIPDEGKWTCQGCHLPTHYSNKMIDEGVRLTCCLICKKKRVNEFLMSTLEPPNDLPIIGDASFVQIRAHRKIEDCDIEDVTEVVPLLDYQVHQDLMHELRVRGMNAVFVVRYQLKLCDKVAFAMMTGTAMRLASHPVPTIPSSVPSLLGKASQEQIKKRGKGFRHGLSSQPTKPFFESPPSALDQIEPPSLNVFLFPEDQFEGYEGKDTLNIDKYSGLTSFVVDLNQPIMPEKAPRFLEKKGEGDLSQKMFSTQHLPSCQPSKTLQSVVMIAQVEIEEAKTFEAGFGLLFDRLTERIGYHLMRNHSLLIGFGIEMESLGDCMQLLCTGMTMSADLSPRLTEILDKISPFLDESPPQTPPTQNTPPTMSHSLSDFQTVFPDQRKCPSPSSSLSPTTSPAVSSHSPPTFVPFPPPSRRKTSPNTSPVLSPGGAGGGLGPAPDPYLPEEALNMRNVDVSIEDEMLFRLEMEGKESHEVNTETHFKPINSSRVTMSHLNYIPDSVVEVFVGLVHFNIIREKSIAEGGFSKFVHHCMAECQSIARAYVAGLGANALVSIRYDVVRASAKDGGKAGYVMISMSGDALRVRRVARMAIKYKKT